MSADARPLYGITPRPEWLKVRVHDNETSRGIAALVADKHLNTVCQEARCPNIFECWGVDRTATFMLMGDVCTRHCGFCAVTQGTGRPLDPEEPRHVAEAVKTLGVRHAVVTSVNRDELPDGGAAHFAATIREIRALDPGVTVEVLIPDFLGSEAALGTVLDEQPEVLNHNTETVERLYKRVRPDAIYARSLELLRRAAKRRDEKKKISLKVKSGVMVGLGETREELRRRCGICAALRRRRRDRGPVPPAARPPPARSSGTTRRRSSRRSGGKARRLGFGVVESGPLVRSSYHARTALFPL